VPAGASDLYTGWSGVKDPASAYFIATAVLCAIVVILLCFALTEQAVTAEHEEAEVMTRCWAL
jgi:hypothetical protein